ncbi:PLP-dependent aminotransferase family protein [Pseudomonas xanthosomatis]|uniref:aminotransferase-like domain-containing protein n=1 Tax=Pseudomonas xanthosomatis TaxID=2842356 RepID=UPI001C3CD46C|nr:PLP-dependent aminotransferase family protein [Pseudomonas xanthosomatis]QXH44356.1 PLP-dependent aminotransferase family protein [Pseudomonas xanthosomatis]
MKRHGTRIQTVMAQIQSRIASRTYTPGARVPSVRAMAQAMQVSVSTVLEAYERLMAEGVLSARRGSGFYVAGPVAPLALTELGPRLDRDVDPLWISRQALETSSDALKPGCGWLPASWMFEAGLRKALRNVARLDTVQLAEYASPLGHPPLRQFLSRRLAGIGLQAPLEQIMLTESGTHAIDLICRFLLQPGDTVLVDDPCYFNFHAVLKAHRVNVVGVRYTATGPDIDAFAAALLAHAPRLYITNSGIHNPTGASLSAVTAHRLLKLADSSSLVIVEDDIFGDFEHTPAPRLAAFDGLARVIQIGSFSKTVSASIRCGYIAARSEWIESLVDLKIATTFGGGRLAANIIHQAITDGGYRKHMESVRQRLAEAMDSTVARLQSIGIKPWRVPQAGMYAWCQLPEGKDAAALARACLSEGMVLAPGNAFSQSMTAGDFLRFNVAQSGDARIYEVLKRALGA